MLNKIYCGNSKQLLLSLDPGIVNLIVTSPPYNVDRNYDVYKDNKPYLKYFDDMRTIFRRCYNILPDDGRVCVNIADVKCGQIPLSTDFHYMMVHDIGFRPYSHIIWNKSQVHGRTQWGSFMSPSMPTLIFPFVPETRMRDYNHEAMFPEELPYRCIKMFSYIGDVVLDPFNGAGTTTLVARKLNRRYIGFELSENHCKTAEKRIKDYEYENRMIL